MDDPWQILKVPKGSSRKSIKRAYRARSKETHPDLNHKKSGEEFRLIHWAYKTITNPVKAGSRPKPKPKSPPKKTVPKKKKVNLNPKYAAKDATLRYYDNDLRPHLIAKPSPPPDSPLRRRFRPRPSGDFRKPYASLDDLIAPENQSELHKRLRKKWLKKMKKTSF